MTFFPCIKIQKIILQTKNTYLTFLFWMQFKLFLFDWYPPFQLTTHINLHTFAWLFYYYLKYAICIDQTWSSFRNIKIYYLKKQQNMVLCYNFYAAIECFKLQIDAIIIIPSFTRVAVDHQKPSFTLHKIRQLNKIRATSHFCNIKKNLDWVSVVVVL